MLKPYITDFFAYCKVVDFSNKSIESLSISLRELTAFVATEQIAHVKEITYGYLSAHWDAPCTYNAL